MISRFPQILENSIKEYEEEKAACFEISEEIGTHEKIEAHERIGTQETPWHNIIALGDNCGFMKYLLDKRDMKGKIKLIYIDPPFFSKANYDAVIRLYTDDGKKLPPVKYLAYEDVWQKDMTEYLTMLCKRLLMMKDLLADDGTIWVHLDWHVVHYVKVFLDEIFGEKNFINEIVWHYKSGGSGKRHFARKHDTILVYGKSSKYYFAPPKEKSYNRGFKPYRFKGVKEYKDEMGWYTMVTMKDVWHVDMVGRTSSERTGYATQKPEALLERIIESSTREGDLCADFFCGSGTLGAVAEKKGRKWICCDGSPLAVSAAMKRIYPYGSAVNMLKEETTVSKDMAVNCDVQFDISCDEISGSDKDILKIRLKDYKIKKLPDSLDEKGKTLLEEALTNSPLSFVEYWSVDFCFDGKVFRPEMFFSREKGRLKLCCERLRPAGSLENICIKTVDALGNCTFTELRA